MKKFFSLLVTSLAFGFASQAQTPITIAAARALPLNSTVTVTGIVTNGSELGAPLRYFQDNTGGIAAYSGSTSIPPSNTQMSSLQPGDSILITGVLKNYNNLLEIDPVTNLQLIASNKPLPAPVQFPAGGITAAFAEQYEGMLVKLNGLTSVTTTAGATFATFAGNTTYRVNGVSGLDMRINAASVGSDGVVGKPSPSGTFDVIGIMGQYQANYQIQPRLYSDFILGNTPNITSAVWASNITTTSLTVNFETQNASTTSVAYGTTSALGQTAASSTTTTNHSVNLSGLQPSTVYYVQVSAINAAGTSTSGIVTVITASASSGDVKVYFNRPVATQYALPGNAAIYLNHTIEDTIIAYIDRAQQTLDVAIYSFGITPIAQALNAAKARGVQIRLIGDGSTTSTAISTLNSSIPRILRNDMYIMHNKFLIIDANSTDPNVPIVLTGSTNFTYNQTEDDANSIVILQDQSIAKVYTMEFNEIWGSATMTAGTPKFGAAKTDNTPHQVMVGNKLVEVYFSPSDNVNNKMIETINSANADIEFSTMLLTRTDIANAIANRINLGGTLNTCSGGLMNDTSQASTPWFILQNAMGARLEKFDGPGIMHHKYIMVDASAPASDPQIFVGSHNWSNSANNNNDENTLIIHDYEITNLYYQEWAQRMLDEDANFQICDYVMSTSDNVAVLPLQVYPNPSKGNFYVQLSAPKNEAHTLRVLDVTGRTVATQTIAAEQAQQPVYVTTTTLPAGIYTVQVSSNSQVSVARVVVQ